MNHYPSRFALLALAAGTPFATAIGIEAAPGTPPDNITEFRANTFTYSAQGAPALAISDDGNFTIVWASRRQESGRSTVLQQHFDANGVAVGEESPLGLWRKNHLTAPVVSRTRDGATWAAWQSAGQDGDGAAIIARRFDRDGRGGSEILANTQRAGDQMAPAIVSLTPGGAAIAWTDVSPGAHPKVMLRLFNSDGAALAPELAVDAGSPQQATTSPSLARAADGAVAVSYVRVDAASGVSLGVWVRVLKGDGTWEGPASQVSEPGAVEPTIAATAKGFVVAWHAITAPALSNYEVFASRLDDAGIAIDDARRVNGQAAGAHHNGAAVAAHADGTIAIAYNRHLDGEYDVLLRLFDEALAPEGDARRLTARAAGTEALTEAVGSQRLAFSADGTLIATWHGMLDAQEKHGIGVTLRHPSVAIRDPLALAGVTDAMRPYLPGNTTANAGADGVGPQPHQPPTFGQRPAELAAREVIASANGIGFTGTVNTGVTPPDPHLAVGPEHVVVIVNGEIAFYTKDGTRTFQDRIEGAEGFWGSVGASDFIFDPEVIYDPTSGRFFAMAAEAFAPGGRSFVLVAVSDDMDPNGDWFRYRFDTTGTSGDLFDSPNIGVTDDAVVITGDGFGRGAVYAVYAYDKASLLAGDPPAISREFLFPTITQSAGYPRVTTGTGDTLYLVEHKEAFANNTQVRVIAFSDLLGTPVTDFVDVTVPAYGVPEDPPQAGTTSRPDTFDARFWSVDQGPEGNLWATHHINPDRVLARWYELSLDGWPTSGNQPQLVQSGDIDLGPGVRTFFSAINAGEDGSVAITYSRSSPDDFIAMGSAYRSPCSPPGTVVETLVHRDTVGGYTLGRWGDYAAVQFDPVAPTVYWAHHEYAQNNSWRTWVQSVDTTTSCTLTDINRDSIVNGVDFRAFRFALDNERCVGDWNRDGTFTQLDLRDFFLQWSACRDPQ